MIEQCNKDFLRIPNWYPTLSIYTFPTSFVKLTPEAINALAEGVVDSKNEAVAEIIKSLKIPMNTIATNFFTSVDNCAPTDTERFAGKRGAVHSPESAWKFLAESQKVREAAKKGEVEYICVRPFRRMNKMREFRLFISNGELYAMSQYNLDRHYFRLEKEKDELYLLAKNFVKSISWQLPKYDFVMDIYFTSEKQILIIDLNPWGEPTRLLLLKSWEKKSECIDKLLMITPPTKISGDVSVSF